jgi:branched-chain amino acid transport system permease protein
MLGALGVNQTLLFTAVFFLGSVLAGLGGALQLPRASVSHHMDLGIIASVFVVVVVGGMGSIVGAFLAAAIISELNAFGILIFPRISLFLMYLVMAVVLIVRPWGILGEQEAEASRNGSEDETLAILPSGSVRWAMAAILLLLLVMPLIVEEFYLVLLTEVFIFALFAASLHFIMSNGGMVSFGHAAYFGLGAYAVAMLVVYGGARMEPAILGAPLAAGLGTAVFGWFCVRVSGVYMAMLSLAFAQMIWSVVFQWDQITGGENGMVGVWPAEWASSRIVFYYIALVICAGSILVLWRMLLAPIGYGLRAGRDSPLRTESIGINLQAQRWLAFVIAGVFAGLAGGLYAFFKGIVDPSTVGISRSIDALMIVLLGGVQSLIGPMVGALTFVGLQDRLATLEFWRLLFGMIIIAICVLMPKGIAGSTRALLVRSRAK